MLALLLAVMGSLTPIRQMPADPHVLVLFSDVLTRGLVWDDYAESAAFIVRENDGSYRCLMWPQTNQFQKQTFNGGMPAGTVAIVHTHPQNAPLPSQGDIEVAQRLHVPNYVLTRTNITAADPISGSAVDVVRHWVWLQKGDGRCEQDWLPR